MEQTIQMVLLAVGGWLADLIRGHNFFLLLVLLVGIGSIVNHAVNRLVEAERDRSDGLEAKLETLSSQLDALEGLTVDGLVRGMEGHIGSKHGESNRETIHR